MRFMFALLAVLFATSANAQSPVVGGPETISPMAEAALTLPEDGNQWYTSVFLESPTAGSPIPGWFDANPTLARLKSQTHFNVVYRTDPQWSKYSPTVPVVPCIVVQNNKDEVVFKTSGENTPLSAEALVGQIRSSLVVAEAGGRCCGAADGQCRCRNCRCPDSCACKRKPAVPDPVPDPVPDTVPDIFVPDTAPPPEESLMQQFSFWLAGLVILAGAAGAIGPKIWKKWKSLDPGRSLP